LPILADGAVFSCHCAVLPKIIFWHAICIKPKQNNALIRQERRAPITGVAINMRKPLFYNHLGGIL
ncbi:hypothetical protein, partial [Intestinimonas massiliensis (ex Afouda et al. 2020)]